MPATTLLKLGSISSAIAIFALDATTPLGFAHGDLYMLSLLMAAFTRQRNFLIWMTALSVLLLVAGITISPPGLEMRYYATNRAMSAFELILVAALASYIMQRFQNLQQRTDHLESLTPSADNPIAPFQYSEQFQLFADAIPQIIWTANADGQLDYANLAFSEYTGIKREMLLEGSYWQSVIAPEDLEQALEQWSRSTAAETLFETEFRIRHRDGTWRWHLLQAAPVKDEHGTLIKWCGSSIDIHDIRTYIQRFEHVANATVDAIWDWDIENNTVWWNHGITTLFGYSRDEVMQSPESWSKHAHPDDRDRVMRAIIDTLRNGGNSLKISYRYIRADGSIADIEENSTVIYNRDGKPVRMIGGMTDVTQRRQLQEQLTHAQRLQTVGELTGGVAHDFNNLLTVIQGNTELLLEIVPEPKDVVDMLDMVRAASVRAAELVQRLLAFARKQPLNPRPTGLRELLDELRPLIRKGIPERIDFDIDIPASLPALMIDPPQLENALMNLCLNARDAIADEGRITIHAQPCTLDADSATRYDNVAPGDYLLISVSDNGAGMTRDTVTRAFDPFFTTKTAGTGSGLGLSMVYGFVKQSGGHIRIRSEQGLGTDVQMLLPCIAEQPASQSRSAAPAQHARKQFDATVLLVEDEDLVRQYAVRQLSQLGLRVIEAENADQALHILDSNEPVDLLFSDVMLGTGMNGAELANAALHRQPSLKVLFTSGYSESALMADGRLTPGTQLLTKPWRRDELVRKLNDILES